MSAKPAPTTPDSDGDEALRVVRQVVAQFLGLAPDAVHDDQDLRAHGADSIDRVEIIVGLKRRFEVTAPLSRFTGIPDLRGLAVFLHQHRGEEP